MTVNWNQRRRWGGRWGFICDTLEVYPKFIFKTGSGQGWRAICRMLALQKGIGSGCIVRNENEWNHLMFLGWCGSKSAQTLGPTSISTCSLMWLTSLFISAVWIKSRSRVSLHYLPAQSWLPSLMLSKQCVDEGGSRANFWLGIFLPIE